MQQISPKLWVGSQADFEKLDAPYGTEWAVVHAARDPWHRALLGYTGRGAPPDHPEYLFAVRGKRLYLNLVDAADPKYIGREVIDEAMRFIQEQTAALASPENPNAVLIACNQGHSRAPTIAMLYVAPQLPEDFEEAVAAFRHVFDMPSYNPGRGMFEFARQNWTHYRMREWIGTGPLGEPAEAEAAVGDALAKAEGIWQTFCDTMKSDPSLARDQLIQSMVTALSAAEPQQDDPNHGRQGSSPAGI